MDRAPRPEPVEDYNSGEVEAPRKKRLIKKLREMFVGDEPQEITLGNNEAGDDVPELWSRTEEANEAETESGFSRLQQLGRNVIEQTLIVQDFAESLNESVETLPATNRTELKLETEGLKAASSELNVAKEDLTEELNEL